MRLQTTYYECPPLLAWTLIFDWAAQITAFETCWVVVGSTMAAGTYSRRRLYGCANLEKEEDVGKATGTFALDRQSARVAAAVTATFETKKAPSSKGVETNDTIMNVGQRNLEVNNFMTDEKEMFRGNLPNL